MGNEKITFEQFCDPTWRREQQMKVKSEAVWVTFLELDGLINKSKIAKQYFGKSQSWLSQKINGTTVCDQERGFTEAEYSTMTAALRDIARRLNEYADAIDAAEIE